MGDHRVFDRWVEGRVQQPFECDRVERVERFRLVQEALVDRVAREPQCCLRRTLRGSRLEHEQPPLLDRELGVLHVPVVCLERAQDLHQLGVHRWHQLGETAMSRVLRTPLTTSSPWALIRKSPDGSGAPVISSREKATPEPEVSPLLPNTICCTLTAVPQSSGIRLIRR